MTKAEKYVRDSIASFTNDPPDSRYQLGYLDALKHVLKEGFGKNK
jgi:hypothetical protein